MASNNHDLQQFRKLRAQAAPKNLRLAERSEHFRDFSTTELLQYTAAQTIQCQQTLEQGLTGLLAQAEEERLRLEEAQDDLLAQDLPSI